MLVPGCIGTLFGSELAFSWEMMGLVLMKSNNGISFLKGHEMKGMRSFPIEQKRNGENLMLSVIISPPKFVYWDVDFMDLNYHGLGYGLL